MHNAYACLFIFPLLSPVWNIPEYNISLNDADSSLPACLAFLKNNKVSLIKPEFRKSNEAIFLFRYKKLPYRSATFKTQK